MYRAVFAFDFSMAKPTMCACVDGKISFYTWPAHIDAKSEEIISTAGVNVHNRLLETVSKGEFSQHTLILEHVNRSTNLAKMILKTIDGIVKENGIDKSEVIIANEAFAFAAHGDAMLDLAGYKYILMYTLISNGYTNNRTYSPTTIKKTAGCGKRGLGKDAMIEALANEDYGIHTFIDIMKDDPLLLKKKTSYALCSDDIADSYWCYKTTMNDLNDGK